MMAASSATPRRREPISTFDDLLFTVSGVTSLQETLRFLIAEPSVSLRNHQFLIPRGAVMSNPATPDPATYPMPRSCPCGPPPQYAPIRETAPISRVTMQDGRPAWLVTGHALARQVLASGKVSSDRSRLGF